jgi:hypothetical protein
MHDAIFARPVPDIPDSSETHSPRLNVGQLRANVLHTATAALSGHAPISASSAQRYTLHASHTSAELKRSAHAIAASATFGLKFVRHDSHSCFGNGNEPHALDGGFICEQLGAPAPAPIASSHATRVASNFRDDRPHAEYEPAPSDDAYPSLEGALSVAAYDSGALECIAAVAEGEGAGGGAGAGSPGFIAPIGMSSGAAGGGSVAAHAAIADVRRRKDARSIFILATP